MTAEFHCWLLNQPVLPRASYPKQREGRMLLFRELQSTSSQGYPRYTVYSRRGGLLLGWLEFRNAWGYYAFRADAGVPINQEIIGEIYAMLKELGGMRIRSEMLVR